MSINSKCLYMIYLITQPMCVLTMLHKELGIHTQAFFLSMYIYMFYNLRQRFTEETVIYCTPFNDMEFYYVLLKWVHTISNFNDKKWARHT